MEDQLLIRKYFCSGKKQGQYSLADLVIYHEIYTAIAHSQIKINEYELPNTAEWFQSLT